MNAALNVDTTGDLPCSVKLKVLADRTRLAVMETLMSNPSHVGRLAELLDVEQSLLSHHLRVLREAGLVTAARDGKSIIYTAAPSTRVSHAPNAINLGCCQLHFAPGLKGTGK